MWSFVNWLLGLILGISSSPLLISVIRVVGQLLGSLPPGAVARCFSLVQQAMEKDDLDGPEKFQWVFDQMMSEYPSLGTSTLNTLIEMVESSIRKGLGV
jgi:hypothetical protein